MNRTSSALNWMVALLAAIGLATAVTTIFVGSGNRELQRDVARRQQEVNQALQLQPLNNQLIQALEDRNTLRQAQVNLEMPHQQAARLRGQVESIAKQVARLSEQGNPNARELVEALRRQGITINPN